MANEGVRTRRARPVADAPIDVLVTRSDELAKGWLVELIARAPLEEAGSILAGELASTGPGLCAALVRALGSDAELSSAATQTAIAAGTRAITRGRDPLGVVQAVDALRAVLWEGVRSELRNPDAELVAALAERLALVVGEVWRAALGPAEFGVAEQPFAAAASSGPELAGAELAGPADGDPRAPEAQITASRSVPPGSVAARSATTMWLDAVEDEVERAQRTRSPLSLLLVELDEAQRIAAVEVAAEAKLAFGRFAQAVRTVVRRQDIMACESETRAWVIARETGRLAAQALGVRIAGAVRSAPPWRGASMTVGVGVAVLGEDGASAAALIAAAEEGRFAAAADGLEVGFAGQLIDEPPPLGPRPLQ
jgi:GGDEF domain-containing protein